MTNHTVNENENQHASHFNFANDFRSKYLSMIQSSNDMLQRQYLSVVDQFKDHGTLRGLHYNSMHMRGWVGRAGSQKPTISCDR